MVLTQVLKSPGRSRMTRCIGPVTERKSTANAGSWNSLQVTRFAAYSEASVAALDAYRRRTSIGKVIGVCILTPLPSLAFVLAVELIPLPPISAGVKENLNVFLRVGIITIGVAYGLLRTLQRFIPEMQAPPTKLLLCGMLTSATYLCAVVVYSLLWVYPLPFSMAQTSMFFVGLLFLFAYVILGKRSFPGVIDIERKLKAAVAIIVFGSLATSVSLRTASIIAL